MSYYSTIEDFPLKNWEYCCNGSIEWTRIDQTSEDCTTEKDIEAWEVLHFDYLERFGISRQHARVLIMQKRLMHLKLKHLETGQRFLLNEIEDIEERLLKLHEQGNDQKNGVDRNLIHLNKVFNCGMDKTKITALQYLLMLQEYGKKD
jgi:hypothetical protein